MGNGAGKFFVNAMAIHKGVTGSCIFCDVRLCDEDRNVKFIVDCGLFQGRDEEENNNEELPINVNELNFVLGTHSHLDHVGRYPMLYAKGYKGKIYCSRQTAEILPNQLSDCVKVLAVISKMKNKKPLYGDGSVTRTLQSIKGCEYGKTISVDERVKVTFFMNGHLYGASIILVQIKSLSNEEINLLFTGDYAPTNVFFPVKQLPEWVKRLPLNVFIESTYGNITSEEIKPCFRENVANAVKIGKSVVIPAFSLGRGQQGLLELQQMQQEGMISKGIPILYCGKLGIGYTRNIFLNNQMFYPEKRQFMPDNCTYVYNTSDVFTYPDPLICIGSAGMGGHGPMQRIIPEFLRRNAFVQFMGYLAEGSVGRDIMNVKYGEDIVVSGRVVRKRAEISTTTEFSAHAKSNELLEFLNQFEKLQTVNINHGRPEVKRSFARKVLDEMENVKDVTILDGEVILRINPFGLQKTFYPKFN